MSEPADLITAISNVAQGNHGGFIYVSLLALLSMWLLYRILRHQLLKLQADLDECNKRHAAADLDAEKQRLDFYAKHNDMQMRAENLGHSVTAMWTYISVSNDRRKPALPPLHDMLDGKVTLEIREVDSPSTDGDRRSTPGTQLNSAAS